MTAVHLFFIRNYRMISTPQVFRECSKEKRVQTEVLVIGGGVTGAGVMRDLALRGVHCVLIDKRDLCAGASGGNHGLLHSGARYVKSDPEAAIECRIESNILKRIAPNCIEETGGFFVAAAGDDLEYAREFPGLCEQAGIRCDEISTSKARDLEPHLADDIQKVFTVPDATIDPFRLALENVNHARQLNKSEYFPHIEVVEFTKKDGEIKEALCRDEKNGGMFTIAARQVVNAGGAWAMKMSKLAGCSDVNLLYSKGTLLVSNDRITDRVINRLRPPADGDILVPGGTVSVLGTTSMRTEDLEKAQPTVQEVNCNIIEGVKMVPKLATTRYIRAFSRVRPLLQSSGNTDDRNVTRGYALFDHLSQGLKNFCTITGGKLTTYRLMAEKTADLVAERLGNVEPSTSATVPLPHGQGCGWTEPGAAPKYWYQNRDAEDMILCECEMVPQSAVDDIIQSAPGAEKEMTLEAIALRSRAGKGPCQGSFCGIRIASYLYDCGYYTDTTGLRHMRQFFNERFKGQRTVVWGTQMAQVELAEALHCGLLGLDLLRDNKSRTTGNTLEKGDE
jgi:glycerol-3-phosphate dehydrogenase